MGTPNKQANALSQGFGVYDHAEHGVISGQLLTSLHATFVAACLAERNNVGTIPKNNVWKDNGIRIITKVLWKTNVASNNRLSVYTSKIETQERKMIRFSLFVVTGLR